MGDTTEIAEVPVWPTLAGLRRVVLDELVLYPEAVQLLLDGKVVS